MVLLVIGAALAIAIGLARGGSLRRLLELRFRWIPLLIAALVVQLGLEFFAPNLLSPAGDTAVTSATFFVAFVFVVANRGLSGMWIVAAGLLLNLLAIAMNGAMPVSQWAARIAGVPITGINDGLKHQVLGSGTLLPWLTDIFPIPAVGDVFSVGDVLIALGISVLIVATMTSITDRETSTEPVSG